MRTHKTHLKNSNAEKKFYKLSNCIKSVSAMQHISRTDFIDKCIWPIKSSSSVKKAF